jgi:hypothetical protein
MSVEVDFFQYCGKRGAYRKKAVLLIETRNEGAYELHMAHIILKRDFFYNATARSAGMVLVTGSMNQVGLAVFYMHD